MATTLPRAEPPPAILQIYRDRVKSGHESEYRRIEEAAARICAELEFPHAHLAIESQTGPKEVWWLNGFHSEADRRQVTDDYATRPALVAALAEISRRKATVTDAPLEVFTHYRADLSRDAEWRVGGARFFAVTVTKGASALASSVFEAPDGTRYIFRPTRTLEEARAMAARAGPETAVFAVRPYWGMPAREWIAADPDFWKPSPMAKAK